MTRPKDPFQETPENLAGRSRSMMVANPGEIWSVAHIDAFHEVMKELVRIHDSKAMSPSDLRAMLMDLLGELRNRSSEHWEDFISNSTASMLQADSLREFGPPEHTSFNRKAGVGSVAWWKQTEESDTALWGREQIKVGGGNGRIYNYSPPFRPVQLDRLPPGTVQMHVTNPVHAATVAIDSVISSMLSDIDEWKNGDVDYGGIWRSLRALGVIYNAVVTDNVKGLKLDDYRDWIPGLPTFIAIHEAPTLIAKYANNSHMMQVLAVRTMAAFIFDALERAENEDSNGTHEDRVTQVYSEISSNQRKIRATLDAFNQMLMNLPEGEAGDFVPYVIARPEPPNTPILALIPIEHADAVRKVVPFPA